MHDYERHTRKAATFVRLAMIRALLRRLAVSASACIQTFRMGAYALCSTVDLPRPGGGTGERGPATAATNLAGHAPGYAGQL